LNLPVALLSWQHEQKGIRNPPFNPISHYFNHCRCNGFCFEDLVKRLEAWYYLERVYYIANPLTNDPL